MYLRMIRRLHAVPSCGSDRLKLHFREGSVADISHIRKAYAPREPWNGENRRIFQLVRDLQSFKKGQNSCYRRNLRAHAFFDMGDVSNWPLRRASKSGVLEKNQKIFHVFSFCCFFTFFGKISWNFWFFGVTLGKISSRSSEPWRKNKKRKFFGLFLAGRNLWNFGATPYCKSEQTRLYHNSAKSARIGLRF